MARAKTPKDGTPDLDPVPAGDFPATAPDTPPLADETEAQALARIEADLARGMDPDRSTAPDGTAPTDPLPEADRMPETDGTPDAERMPETEADRLVDEILAATPDPVAAPDDAQRDDPQRDPALRQDPIVVPADPAAAAPVAEDEAYDPPARRGIAATLLYLLVGALVVAGGTIWAAPRLVPHLPPALAALIAPGGDATAERLAALETALADQTAALAAAQAEATARLSALEGAAPDAARLDALDQGLAALRADLAALRDAVAATPTGTGGGDPALAALVADLQAQVAALAPPDLGALTAMEARLAEMSAKLDTAAGSAAEAEAARTQALAQVETAVRAAALKGGLASLRADLATGVSYGAALDALVTLTGTPAPEPLAAHRDGLPSIAVLTSRLPLAAQAALAADVAARNDGTTLGAVTTWAFGQITPRPTVETAGDDVGAILSRVAARLNDRDLPAALAEAQSLPEPARLALGDWFTSLSDRVAAEQALDAWTADLGANG